MRAQHKAAYLGITEVYELMTAKSIPPSITETAFECPYCDAFTTQDWFQLHADGIGEEQRTPIFPDEVLKENFRTDRQLDKDLKENILNWIEKVQSGLIFLEHKEKGSYIYNDVHNLFLSQCYNCKKIAVWVHQSLVFPPQRTGVVPNVDLPTEIIQDFEEARIILNYSPRGAAALLRLCIQKLCIFLGEKGKNIDEDIASLVSKGLNPLVQKSLDIVRVIGNEAVHPGTIDLKDDRDTSIRLLEIVNVIADQMISHPKAIQAMYEKLPEGKKRAIDARNERVIRKTLEV